MGAAEKLISENLDKSLFDQRFDQRFETKMAEREASHVPSLSIIATKGTMDWAYPPFILASTASAPVERNIARAFSIGATAHSLSASSTALA